MFNTMEVFWTGPNGSVQDRYYYDGSGWNGFTLSGGLASTTGGVAALSRDPRCMAVWWIDSDGSVQDANWNNGGGCERHSASNSWNQWQLAPAGSASTTSSIAAVSRSSNTIELFWIAPDGHVQDASWYPNGDWSQSTLPFAPPGSAAGSGAWLPFRGMPPRWNYGGRAPILPSRITIGTLPRPQDIRTSHHLLLTTVGSS